MWTSWGCEGDGGGESGRGDIVGGISGWLEGREAGAGGELELSLRGSFGACVAQGRDHGRFRFRNVRFSTFVIAVVTTEFSIINSKHPNQNNLSLTLNPPLHRLPRPSPGSYNTQPPKWPICHPTLPRALRLAPPHPIKLLPPPAAAAPASPVLSIPPHAATLANT